MFETYFRKIVNYDFKILKIKKKIFLQISLFIHWFMIISLVKRKLIGGGGMHSTKLCILLSTTSSQIRPQTREWGSIYKLISNPNNVELLDFLLIFGCFLKLCPKWWLKKVFSYNFSILINWPPKKKDPKRRIFLVFMPK